MAITIRNTFADVVAIQKPLVLTATSTNTSRAKFRYVLTVDINGIQAVKLKQQKNQNNWVHFDISRVIEDYLKETNETDDATPVSIHKTLTGNELNDSAKFIELNCYEEYATSADANPVEFPSTGNAADSFLAINTTSQFTDGVIPTLAGVYEFNNDATKISWLSNMPTTSKTRAGEYQVASILASGLIAAVSTDIEVNYSFYTANGTLILSQDIDRVDIGLEPFVAVKSSANADKLYQSIPVGYQNLEEQTFNTSIRPSLQTNLSYYEIGIIDTSGQYNTKTYRFDVVEDCKYTPVQLAWINRLGAWDYYSFELASIESLKVKRESIVTPFGNWGGAAIYDYSQFEAGETIYKVEGEKEFTINSDWLEDSSFVWLQELITSKRVQYVNENGDFSPIILTDTSYSVKKEINQKLNNLQLKFKQANKIR